MAWPVPPRKKSLIALFAQYGKAHSAKLVTDLFTGKCRGFAEVKMEGHEARNAIDALNLKDIDGSTLRVEVFKGTKKAARRRR